LSVRANAWTPVLLLNNGWCRYFYGIASFGTLGSIGCYFQIKIEKRHFLRPQIGQQKETLRADLTIAKWPP
jgi:hypothetical protein